MEHFDENEVLDLIEEALEEKVFEPERSIPLGFMGGSLLEILANKLPSYMPIPDVQVVLDDLRDELFAGVNIGDIKTLHSIAKNCRRCPLMTPDPKLPLWNISNPDVVFVAESPLNHKESVDLLIETLKVAGFSSQLSMLTYSTRCIPKEYRKANKDEIKTCLNYLHSELQILQPKLIVTFGALASAAVLGADVRIVEERGKIYWLGAFPIMPTFSPAYVLKGADHLRPTFEQDMMRAHNFVYGEL